MVTDMACASVMSLNAATLDGGKEIVTLAAKEKLAEDLVNIAEDVNFAVNGNTVYTGFVAQGSALTCKASDKEETLSFSYKDEAQERAFIITKVDEADNATIVLMR